MSKTKTKTDSTDATEPKSLDVTSAAELPAKVSDVQLFGNPDLFRCLSKASSASQGWMKSTKAMEIPGLGVLVQVTTQQRNPDGSYAVAEALSFIHNAKIEMGEEQHLCLAHL